MSDSLSVYHINNLALISDEELYGYLRSLKDQIFAAHEERYNVRADEEDLCYVQREVEIRRRRHDFKMRLQGQSSASHNAH